MGDFGHAVKDGIRYQIWPIRSFTERFRISTGLRPDEDCRSLIFAHGGPFPSKLISYSFSVNEDQTEIWIKLETIKNEDGSNGFR